MKRPILKKNLYKKYLPYLENLGLPKAVHKEGHKIWKHQSQCWPSTRVKCTYYIVLKSIKQKKRCHQSGRSRISLTGGGGANPKGGGGANLLFRQNVPENCMKMKEIGPGRLVLRVPGSANDQSKYPLEIALSHNIPNETFPINANTR